MDSISRKVQKDCTNVDSQESKDETSLVSDKCGSKLDISNVKRLRGNSSCPVPNIHKHITTVDEKYVLRCLELIHTCAARAAASSFASKVHVLPDELSKTRIAINSTDELAIGSLTGSRSMMMNILKSPLLQQFGSIDFDVDFGQTPLSGVREPSQNEVAIDDHRLKRLVSKSTTNSRTSFQGMLQCTWKDGMPHHVFSVDDRTEVYVANLSSNNKVLDYVYTFHSSNNSDCVGTMRVSSSITLCSDNSQVSETQFVLSASSDDPKDTSTHIHRKTKTLTKVANAFHSYKQRTSSKFWGSSTIFEDVHDSVEKMNIPNLEMAAVVVRDAYKSPDPGGWGLKFLKKSERSRNHGECSTSIDVLIPAGLHGGPKTRVCGPSSLTERWISGGRCDCGGWDIGCPLTILNPVLSSADFSGECKTIDLFIKGSQDFPMVKMVNIHEGLYYIHFRSNLSSLQCFAIAVAIIHSHSPVFRQKMYRS